MTGIAQTADIHPVPPRSVPISGQTIMNRKTIIKNVQTRGLEDNPYISGVNLKRIENSL